MGGSDIGEGVIGSNIAEAMSGSDIGEGVWEGVT